MISRTCPLVTVFLGWLFSSLCSCGPSVSISIRPHFRHPLLHQEKGIFTRSPVSFQEVSLVDPRTETRCNTGFSHPLLNHCETWPGSQQGPPVDRKASFDRRIWHLSRDPLEHQLAIARRARSMLQFPNTSRGFGVGDKLFRKDCSGLVMAIFSLEKLPLDQLIEVSDTQSGVAALYKLARLRGLLHQNKVPAIGDLVFFSNTYDRNHDGRINDSLTHVGIVERVDADGTVSFIHHARGGVLRYKLNRFKPAARRDHKSKKVYNHYLRIGPTDRRSRTGRRLTGQLFQAFATLIF